MRLRLLSACFVALTCESALGQDLRDPAALNRFCIDPNLDGLCPIFPDDQTQFSDKFVYMFINVATQTPFDVFSWQAFTSLNWSATGLPSPEQSTDWQGFSRREAVFDDDLTLENCGEFADGAEVITSNLVQSDGNALIDQNGNPIIFETRINRPAEDYILAQLLNTYAGQLERGSRTISFPQGRLGDDPTAASVLVKTSWQILSPLADVSDYIVREGLIYVPPEDSTIGQGQCLRERLGMVGMHIVSRIQSGNGDEWLWSTFEHHSTSPTARNARKVNNIFSNDLFPSGCSAPDSVVSTTFILYDLDCPDCLTNRPPEQRIFWAEHQPYAYLENNVAAPPSQIVRCWEVFEGTVGLNTIWQEELAGTPLANYQLISTQWRGADISPMFEHGEVPRFLSNTTMETYLQASDEGTCLGCHAEAKTSTGADANFTFLLREPPDQ